MPVFLVLTPAFLALAVGYRWYSRWLARSYALTQDTVTPAVARTDGNDFVPTPKFYLLGQHFSAIAAAGPIAGPILACQVFGWVPCVLWIVFGVIFIGAVHDFSALVASVRHDAQSIAELARQHLGRGPFLAFCAFIWLALVYVLVAFTDITAATFVGQTEELRGLEAFNAGGAVALSSATYLTLALIMGLVQRFLRPPLWLVTVIFVPLAFVAVWTGTLHSTLFLLSARQWALVILAYCAIAAMLPLWLLMQPRGYLGGFVLYAALAVGFIGVFFGGGTVAQPAFTGFSGAKVTDSLFPFLFVTIACGACSGFHGLVCSGTTSKQVQSEPDCRQVGYGAMILEAVVALLALSTVLILSPGEIAGRGAGRIYGDGLGRYLTLVLGDGQARFAATFGAMAFSTFVFDTVDVTTRLGRYLLQEITGRRNRIEAWLATFATVAIPLLLLTAGDAPQPGQPPAYLRYWTLFGTANQLLAALTLAAVAVWLRQAGRPNRFVLWPMLFVLLVTATALVLQIMPAVSAPTIVSTINGLVAAVLLALAGYFLWACRRATVTDRVRDSSARAGQSTQSLGRR